MGQTSIGVSRAMAACISAGCFMMAYPWPSLVELSSIASKMFSSVSSPYQSMESLLYHYMLAVMLINCAIALKKV